MRFARVSCKLKNEEGTTRKSKNFRFSCISNYVNTVYYNLNAFVDLESLEVKITFSQSKEGSFTIFIEPNTFN